MDCGLSSTANSTGKFKRSFLYHSNYDALVIKTTLDGDIVWIANFSDWETTKPQYWPMRPTQAAVVRGTDMLLVADGYGSSFVHTLDKYTGEFLEGRSFGGGRSNGTSPLQFNTPHGIYEDPRIPGSLVVSDRSNSRLVWVTASGEFLKAQSTAAVLGMRLPCNVDVHEDPKAGEVGITPSLGKSYSEVTNGSAAIYSANGTVLSVIEVAKQIGHP